ncbi:MAG: quinol:electron acceptor oxidoreductase subunit ActD, partial [Dehalococcoidia bacterium]
PEGAFGEKTSKHRLYVFPFIGAAIGFTVAILLTTATQVSYPLVTGGKPILSIPPMAIIAYEGTMLGAIIFTVLGIIFESRLPRAKLGLYDERITEGYVGILVTTTEDRIKAAKEVLTKAGAEDIKEGEPD